MVRRSRSLDSNTVVANVVVIVSLVSIDRNVAMWPCRCVPGAASLR